MSSRVPIPRLSNQHTDQKPGRRIARACDECRSRKSKCNGHRPICGQCTSAGLESCVYSDPKRSREQKALESANEQVARYECILREIYQEVDKRPAKKIKEALSLSSAEQGSQNGSSSASSGSSVSFLENMDVLDEDINQSKISRATGYLGKSSEVAWMRSLEREIRNRTSKELASNISQMPQSDLYSPIASINYRVESDDYPGQEDENIYALPARAPAERLLRLFLDSVQPSLPIIRQALFLEQFNSLYSGESIHPGRKWLAVLNLIFAISSRLCQNSGQDIHNRDHQYYFRAEKLNISESLVEGHEDLQQVQVETLAALYLLTSSQINRAWKMIGTATRSSIALGLHLRAVHNKLNAVDLEARHRLWWSIFILENLLSTMTGRGSALANSFCSAPPPPLASEAMEYFSAGMPELQLEQPSDNPHMEWTIHQQRELLNAQRASLRLMDPTNELYFFCLADLAVISHTASCQVYSTDAVDQKWGKRKRCIKHYNRIMEEWRSSLPESMGFEEANAGPVLAVTDAYRISLAMHYYSSKIVLNRPCLTPPRKAGGNHLKRQTSNTRKQNETTCLDSALAILSIFPDQPDPVWVCHVPWWNALHFLVQATTILLINISLDSISETRGNQSSDNNLNNGQLLESSEMTNCKDSHTAAQKALRWLNCLGKADNSARRAFELCNTIVRCIAPGCFDLDEFPAEAASNAPYPAVPSDQNYQQHRSKLDVPYSQFAGTTDYGFDCRGGDSRGHVDLAATEDFDVPEQIPSVTSLVMDTDAPGYIFDAEYAMLDETLRSLASPGYEAI